VEQRNKVQTAIKTFFGSTSTAKIEKEICDVRCTYLMTHDYWVVVTWFWQRNTEVPAQKPVPLSLCPP